jgi:hypothetical protein
VTEATSPDPLVLQVDQEPAVNVTL